MPHYDYECKKCLHSEEVFQKMSDEPLTKCPSCKKKQFRRIITQVTGFVKGGNTVGHLAEKNTKKLGKYALEEKVLEHSKRSEACKRHLKKNSPNKLYGKLDEKTRNKVLKNAQTKRKYILEGKVD